MPWNHGDVGSRTSSATKSNSCASIDAPLKGDHCLWRQRRVSLTLGLWQCDINAVCRTGMCTRECHSKRMRKACIQEDPSPFTYFVLFPSWTETVTIKVLLLCMKFKPLFVVIILNCFAIPWVPPKLLSYHSSSHIQACSRLCHVLHEDLENPAVIPLSSLHWNSSMPCCSSPQVPGF